MVGVTAFVASLGVNTHVDATSGPYGDVALVARELAYLGIGHIRDHAWDSDLAAYRVLATGGVRFDLIVDDQPTAAVAAMAPIVGSIESFEGANEVDTRGGTVAAHRAQQAALFAAVKANPATTAIPVLNLSVADPGNFATYAGAPSQLVNLHAYAAWGDVPQLVLPGRIGSAARAGKSTVITETGYFTMLNNKADPSGVDETTQAALTLDTVLDSFSLGVTQTYLYELFDEGADPGNINSEMHYGLFHADGAPKPAATAIHNLTRILAAGDGGAVPALRPEVAGLPESGRSLALMGTDGGTFLVVWAEPKIWDTAKQAPITAAAAAVTVDLGAVAGSVSVYDPMVGTGPVARYSAVSRITVSVTDHPLVIRAAR